MRLGHLELRMQKTDKSMVFCHCQSQRSVTLVVESTIALFMLLWCISMQF